MDSNEEKIYLSKYKEHISYSDTGHLESSFPLSDYEVALRELDKEFPTEENHIEINNLKLENKVTIAHKKIVSKVSFVILMYGLTCWAFPAVLASGCDAKIM